MAKKGSIAIDTVPLPERPVRIVLPASVAFDLEKLHKSMKLVAERLGHPNCMSGVDCSFMMERDFVIDPKTLDVISAITGR